MMISSQNRITVKAIFLFLLLSSIGLPQSVFEPVHSEIYDFLERMNANGIVEFHSEIKPIARTDIAQLLISIESEKQKLSSVDRDDLEFFKSEYFDEIRFIKDEVQDKPRLEYFEKGISGRFRFFSYNDEKFSLFADPVFGYSFNSVDGERVTHRWNGIKLFGYFDKHWGFDLNFRDNDESGNNIDFGKQNTPESGINISKKSADNLQYSELRGGISYTWSSGSLTAGKDFFNIGSGQEGQLILSSKAPSFPFIRFDFSPVSWLKFIYIHGWLKSNIPDSSSIRHTLVENRESISPIPKYIASHLVSFYPGDDLSVSLGESVVYSGDLQPVYLIPVMFFRLADHYLSAKGSNSGANAQLFADASYRLTGISSKVYSTIFIDELSLESLSSGNAVSAIGYTFGGTISDPVFPGSFLNIEYTRLNPFVYMNSNDAHLYRNDNYQLGHWIGSNGDIISVKYSQKIIRALSFSISGWYFRKGKTELPEQQYEVPYPDFLYGSKRIDKNVTISVIYRPIHELFAKAYFLYSDISDSEDGRTPAFKLEQLSDFGISLYYGL
jgi:Capsule assembly protein Wzi